MKLMGFFGIRSRIKLNLTPLEKAPEGPCIVLANHVSYWDWYYVYKALRTANLRFVMARCFFYNKTVARFLKSAGTIPKSVFTPDIESARETLRAIRNGDTVVIFPAGRVTPGCKSESLSSSTASLLKKAGVPVYGVHIDGGSLACPKWASTRRGCRVDVRAEQLFTPEELKSSSVFAIESKTEQFLRFDDFKWLLSNPNVQYKCHSRAKGLENVLYTCPKCGEEFTLGTRGDHIFCKKCGFDAVIDTRYNLISDSDCPSNYGEWFDREYIVLKNEVTDENFQLKSKMTYKRPGGKGFSGLYKAGKGDCVLNQYGLTYTGTIDKKPDMIEFRMKSLTTFMFSAGKKIEFYNGHDYYCFVPDNRQECIKWYLASGLLSERYNNTK